jgi:hypothetical protein
MSAIDRGRPREPLIPPIGGTINTYLPMELLREIFLYSIESNQMKSGQLASVCRYWRSVITTMAHLWSTLRVGTWTETEQVVTWLQRAYPKKVIIDPQEIVWSPSDRLQCLLRYRILLRALASGTSLLFPHFLLRTWLVSLAFKSQTQ